MGSGKEFVAFRCSSNLLAAVDSVARRWGADAGRGDVILFFLEQFFENPIYMDPLDVKELRVPVTKTINLLLPESIIESLRSFASTHKTNVSAVIRLAIYLGALNDKEI